MANCVEHTRCPACAKHGQDRSGNNLGVYDDGSTFCFRCRYYTPAVNCGINAPRTQRQEETGIGSAGSDREPKIANRCTLPKDSIGLLDPNTPLSALDWIWKYDLTVKEISDNLLLFSEKGVFLQKKQEQTGSLVIFPVYCDGDLMFWTGRNLSYAGTGTKWVIQGKKADMIYAVYPEVWYSKANQTACCVCEDIISTIKLGRIIPTYTLFGTSISNTLLKYLSLNYNELLIYLDYDAVDIMLKLADKVRPYFDKVRVIISSNDPKLYSTEELREIIR
jgi:hypothetical protein